MSCKLVIETIVVKTNKVSEEDHTRDFRYGRNCRPLINLYFPW